MTPLSDAAKEAGITYRQADHWVHREFVRCQYVARKSGKRVPARLGAMQGRMAVLTPFEHRVLSLMAGLVKAGITPEAAAKAARRMVKRGAQSIDLAPGIQLSVGEVA